MAIFFGKDTFEGESLPGLFDSQQNPYGASTLAIDNTSKVNATNSLSATSTAEAANFLLKDFGVGYSEVWLQYYLNIPTGWTIPTGGFCGHGGFLDASDNQIVELKIEFGTDLKLIVQGSELPYLDTGVILTANNTYKIEVYVKKSATVGEVKVWVNNDVEGSPTYAIASQNTGATQIRKLNLGISYTPASLTKYYFDDVSVGDSFIGSGSPAPEPKSFRANINGGVNIRPRAFSPGFAR